jgi:hypothetical protein
VNKNLIDDHLEEKRGDQAEQLQEERGQQNLGEQSFIFDDGGDEPFEAKG